MKTRRPRSTTPEERAAVLSQQSYMASGNSYISVVMREDQKHGRVPYYDDPAKCTHGVSMCPTWECVESWSMDYQVNLHLTGAGRRCATALNIDPIKFATAERRDMEVLKQEDFRLETD